MKNRRVKPFICMAVIILAVSLFSLPVLAQNEGSLEVIVEDTYATGSPVVIMVRLTDSAGKPIVLDDPQSIKLVITKPSGDKVESVTRQSGWNEPGEYYDIYTIDTLGEFQVSALEESTGLEGNASFTSVFITPGSISLLVLAIVLFGGSVIFLRKKND